MIDKSNKILYSIRLFQIKLLFYELITLIFLSIDALHNGQSSTGTEQLAQQQ